MPNYSPEVSRSQQSKAERSLRRWRRWLIVLLLLALAALAFCVFSLIPSAYERGLYDSSNESYWAGFNYGKRLGAASNAPESESVREVREWLEQRHSDESSTSPSHAPTVIPEVVSPSSVSIPYGHSADEIVYVSKRSGTIHSVSTCSGMKYYSRMTLEEALVNGFTHYCEHCF